MKMENTQFQLETGVLYTLLSKSGQELWILVPAFNHTPAISVVIVGFIKQCHIPMRDLKSLAVHMDSTYIYTCILLT